MSGIFEVHDEYARLGIFSRKITLGNEFDLVRRFIDYRKDAFSTSDTNHLAVFIEPKVNNSYPDIVFVEYNPENYSKWETARNDLGPTDLKMLYHIYNRGCIDASSIIEETGASWKAVMLSVEKLYDSKLVSRKRGGWCILNRKDIALNRIEAIEAKIDKIEVAFQQALLNTAFASESYVLSNNMRTSADKLSKMDGFGIGMYASYDRSFHMIKKSAAAVIPVNFNSIFFNEYVGRILNN